MTLFVPASDVDIRRWLMSGKDKGATHVIIVCDTFSWDDYPIYVKPGEDPRVRAEEFDGKNMQKIIEVYALHMDIEAQLKEHRARHYDLPVKDQE